MKMEKKAKRPRIGGLIIVAVAAVALILPLVLNAERWFGGSAGPTIQPMELHGAWLGMRLTGVGSPTARNLGVPDTVEGVVVTEVMQVPGSRALQAGLAPGDVVTRIDGKDVKSLTELYKLSTKLDSSQHIPVDIVRQGRLVAAVLPGLGPLPGSAVGAAAWGGPQPLACPNGNCAALPVGAQQGTLPVGFGVQPR